MKNILKVLLCLSALLFTLTNALMGAEHIENFKENLPTQVCNYLDHLPKMETINRESTALEKAERIVKFLKEFYPQRAKTEKYLKKLTGESKFTQQIQRYLDESRLIPMRFCGFPFKSTNTEKKVLGYEVDMAEFVSVLTVHHICCEIGKIHPQGARVVIISDGIVFKDILRVSDQDFFIYQNLLKKIIAPFQNHIEFLCPALNEYETFLKQNNEPVKKIKKNIFKDMLAFAKAELDCDRWNPEVIIDPLDAKTLTMKLATESAKYSLFMKQYLKNYSDFVHLNVHPQKDLSYRCPISVFHGAHGTPWHLTPVFTAQTVVLEKRESELKRYKKQNPEPLAVARPKDLRGESGLENLNWVIYLHNLRVYETILNQRIGKFTFNGVELKYFIR